MVIERAEIFIKDGMMDEAVAVLREKALPLTKTYVGCRKFTALRGVENAQSIMFWVEWDSIAAHEESRVAPEHAAFRALILPFASGANPTVHFEVI